MSIPEPDMNLSGAELGRMVGLMVYAWVRGSRYLYVGVTSRGLHRLLTHNVIGRVEGIAPKDKILVYLCSSWKQAAELELVLSDKFQPKYSVPINNAQCESRTCPTCKNSFVQKRRWQKFCSKDCRQGIRRRNV